MQGFKNFLSSHLAQLLIGDVETVEKVHYLVLVRGPNVQDLPRGELFDIILPGYLGDFGNRTLRAHSILSVIVGLHIQLIGSAPQAVHLLPPQLHLLELALPPIVGQQPSLQRALLPEHQLEGLSCQNHPHQAGQHPHHAKRRTASQTHLVIAPQASVTQAAAAVAGDLRLPPYAGSTQQLPFSAHAVVVHDVSAGGVVGAVNHQVILIEQTYVLHGDEGVLPDANGGVQGEESAFEGGCFLMADCACAVADLSMKVGEVDLIGVKKAQSAYPCCSQVEGQGAANSSCAHKCHPGPDNFSLTLVGNLFEEHLPGVPLDQWGGQGLLDVGLQWSLLMKIPPLLAVLPEFAEEILLQFERNLLLVQQSLQILNILAVLVHLYKRKLIIAQIQGASGKFMQIKPMIWIIQVIKLRLPMQGRENKRLERFTLSKKEVQQPPRRSSLSSTKMFNKLSMSFYDDSTARKHKQLIVDSCPFDFKDKMPFDNPPPAKSKPKLPKSAPRKKRRAEVAEEKDEMDFRTTQESKILTKEEGKKGAQKGRSSANKTTREKGNSLQKFRRILLADLVLSRIKNPLIFNKKQVSSYKKI